jgi:hypothetical protein
MRPRKTANPKRKIASAPSDDGQKQKLGRLAGNVTYGGNPEHKRNPGDFGLQPPSIPRKGKTLCDEVGIFTRKEALALIREGVKRGLVSIQERNGFPQNIWAVAPNGRPIEAMLENPQKGTYHGYPLQTVDVLGEEVLERWEKST